MPHRAPYRSSRFHAKSRPPLIQPQPTGHSSRTAHYDITNSRKSSSLLSFFSLSPSFLSSIYSYQIIIIVVCFAARSLHYSLPPPPFPLPPSPSPRSPVPHRGGASRCHQPPSSRVRCTFPRWVAGVTGNLFLNLLPMTDRRAACKTRRSNVLSRPCCIGDIELESTLGTTARALAALDS